MIEWLLSGHFLTRLTNATPQKPFKNDSCGGQATVSFVLALSILGSWSQSSARSLIKDGVLARQLGVLGFHRAVSYLV